eukprot:NODE_27932_length_495_cov_2.407609.p3 GENE.NODE_27932_length_495_cov_2.407609~~NODE_27932_length_495_cov_2.407609.p3  ORF type:complete len:77 (+),score=21.06 NODE_27932_length_495_cov_2.407609:252-482(+)
MEPQELTMTVWSCAPREVSHARVFSAAAPRSAGSRQSDPPKGWIGIVWTLWYMQCHTPLRPPQGSAVRMRDATDDD